MRGSIEKPREEKEDVVAVETNHEQEANVTENVQVPIKRK